MKFFRYLVFTCLLLISVNSLAQTLHYVYADASGVSFPSNWRCEMTLPGYFHVAPINTYPDTDKSFSSFIFNQDKKTASASTYDKTATYFLLYDQYSRSPIADIDCSAKDSDEGSDVKFKLDASCAKQIPMGKKIYIRGKISGNDPKNFQFSNSSCLIK